MLSVLFCSITSFANFSNNISNTGIKFSPLFNHDAQVVIIYTLAKVPILSFGNQVGNEFIIYSVIKNSGTQNLISIPVTLNVNGVNNSTETITIPSLAPDSSVSIAFTQIQISVTGINNIMVSVPNDDDNTNNVASCTEENTMGLYSMADNAAPAGSFGFGTGSGLIIVKYPNHHVTKVTAVRGFISDDPANIGKTIYAVVLNQNGQAITSQSSNIVLTAADLGKYIFLPVTPNPFISGVQFFVGLAQTASATPYYPVAYQDEIPTRPQAYYTRAALTGNTFAAQDTGNRRFMIQAVMNNAIIPVTLLSFTARRNGMVNELAWSTSQEINSKEFIIERSNDGVAFMPLGNVNASGNSSVISVYRFTDTKPIKGINYYRLRSVDIDGEFKLSEIKTVTNTGDAGFSVYPNPVNDILNITVDAAFPDKGLVTITDISGREIYTAAVNVNTGNNIININAGTILAGTYILKLKLSNGVFVKQFTKM